MSLHSAELIGGRGNILKQGFHRLVRLIKLAIQGKVSRRAIERGFPELAAFHAIVQNLIHARTEIARDL